MTDFRTELEHAAQELELAENALLCSSFHNSAIRVKAAARRARAALAQPEPKMVYRYSPVTIAECGGPCEQGPEYCDCGEIKGELEPQPELQGPTDEELKAAYWEAFKDAAPCGAEESWLAGLRAVARSASSPSPPSWRPYD